MLSILHIGNGALPAFTMGGIILSILSARYADKGDGWKLRNGLTVAVLLLLVGIGAHHFWIVAKIGGTPPWVFYVTAISVALYTLLGYLGQPSGHGLVQSDTPCRNGYADYLSGALCLLWLR